MLALHFPSSSPQKDKNAVLDIHSHSLTGVRCSSQLLTRLQGGLKADFHTNLIQYIAEQVAHLIVVKSLVAPM